VGVGARVIGGTVVGRNGAVGTVGGIGGVNVADGRGVSVIVGEAVGVVTVVGNPLIAVRVAVGLIISNTTTPLVLMQRHKVNTAASAM
jgi:hypothetical protein